MEDVTTDLELWPGHSSDIVNKEGLSFAQVGALDEVLVEALSNLGYKTPTPIQLLTCRAISPDNNRKIGPTHIMAQAKNGTGKTLAFTVLMF